MKNISLYADGAAIRNPGPGGYAAILVCGNDRQELSAGFRHTTNNRMEILSVIVGLRTLQEPCKVRVVSDSKYVVNGINQWIALWKRKKWISKKAKKPVLNQDLWLELDQLMAIHKVHAIWIRGHTESQSIDALENKRADYLAEYAARKLATRYDYVYEKINPAPDFKASSNRATTVKPPPIITDLNKQLSQADHEALIQAELNWAYEHMESD